MFVDEADIHVKGGDGGSGCISFRHEKFAPMGGPDGGDGGHGGSVILMADPSVDTLFEFSGHHHWRAGDGQAGSGSRSSGKSGQDVRVRVPVGTIVFDSELGLQLADLDQPGAEVIIARGGRGGHGNARFASSTQQAPRFCEPGTPGQERKLHFELKLIADVGLIGLPNAGKSTLLSRLSAARPRIADYPFTTLEPQLGICELTDERRIVLADLPGLIEGAHSGVGLGDAFLRHIERTRVLCHLVEATPIDGSDPLTNYRSIRKELTLYSKLLADKAELVVVTKLDLPGADAVAAKLAKKIGRDVVLISAVTGQGLRNLAERLWQMIRDAKAGRLPLKPRPPRRSVAKKKVHVRRAVSTEKKRKPRKTAKQRVAKRKAKKAD
ncbi:MAG: GTPase ObgE [Phycisphaerae bacterium]|nr:GTPase ObgE [Phycisphaerae bacterium]